MLGWDGEELPGTVERGDDLAADVSLPPTQHREGGEDLCVTEMWHLPERQREGVEKEREVGMGMDESMSLLQWFTNILAL